MIDVSSYPPLPHLVLTSGEPAGIGPDLCLLIAGDNWPGALRVLGDIRLFRERAAQLGSTVQIHAIDAEDQQPRAHQPGHLWVEHHPLCAPCSPGCLNPENATYVLALLQRGLELCQQRPRTALVTAPVQKSVINEAGIPFSGHTEFFQERCGVPQVVMMLAGPSLRVALVTTHLPLRQVAEQLTAERLRRVLLIVHQALQQRWQIAQPRIGLCGLNPHAGESGHLGTEEQLIMQPVIDELRHQGLNLSDPLPADTLFTPAQLARFDVIVAMYHDQGLPVLKHLSFGAGINITLGLPIIRLSVDHGTALNLAGTGQINTGSMQAALRTAFQMLEPQ